MNPISSLIPAEAYLKAKQFKLASNSERAELIKVFHEGVLNKQGKPYSPAFIASRLSPYSLADLRYMISDCKLNWDNNLGKYFWCLFKS